MRGRGAARTCTAALCWLLAGCGMASPASSPESPANPATAAQSSTALSPTAAPSQVVESGSPPASLPSARTVTASATIPLTTPAHSLVATGDAIWVAGDGKAERIDPDTNEVTATVELEAGYDGFGITYGFGSLWVAAFDAGKVARLDPDTGRTVGEIDVGGAPEGLLAAFGSIWVARHREATVSRIDPSTNEVVAMVQVGQFGPGGPAGLAAIAEKVWVAVPNISAVVGIDVDANKGSGSFKVPDSFPCGLAAAADVLWSLACFDAPPRVHAIDPVTATGLGSVPVDGLVLGAREIGDRVWISTIAGLPPAQGPGRLLGVDPATFEVTDVVELEGPGEATVAFGSLWVASMSTLELRRFDIDQFAG